MADFGLSGLEHTITGSNLVQNPVWQAPELLGQSDFTLQTDIYAFGVILWELISRKDFFEGITFMSLIAEKVQKGERPEIPADCKPAYAKLIEDCWAQGV